MEEGLEVLGSLLDGEVELGRKDDGETLVGAVEVGAELGLVGAVEVGAELGLVDEGALDDGADVGLEGKPWPASILAMARKRIVKYTTRNFITGG